MSEPISVFLITLNEVAHIEQVLERVAWADEVVVLDSGSTDGLSEETPKNLYRQGRKDSSERT